jgi:hypothetical protein
MARSEREVRNEQYYPSHREALEAIIPSGGLVCGIAAPHKRICLPQWQDIFMVIPLWQLARKKRYG